MAALEWPISSKSSVASLPVKWIEKSRGKVEKRERRVRAGRRPPFEPSGAALRGDHDQPQCASGPQAPAWPLRERRTEAREPAREGGERHCASHPRRRATEERRGALAGPGPRTTLVPFLSKPQ